MLKKLTSLVRTKNRFYSSKKEIFFYVLGFFFFLAIRTVSIHSIPSVISHDEIYYPAEARALAVSGHDPSGMWNPWSLTSAHPLYAELPGVVMTPAALLFKDPILAAKATHIFLGTLLCLVIAAFAYQVTKNKQIAGIAFILAGINPWLFQFSRMGFDAVFSLFFLLSGVTVYLASSSTRKIWSLPFFFIGFFQYQGFKVLFVPLIFATVLFDLYSQDPKSIWRTLKKKFLTRDISSLIPAIVVITFTLALFGTYMVRLSSQAAGQRSADLIFTDIDYISTQTNIDRQQTFSSPVTSYFINKGTAIFDRFISQYFESFSWHHLFITGEPLRNPFSVWKHGMFYLLDIVLIIMGATYIAIQKKVSYSGVFLGFLVLIAPLAGALNAKGSWIMFRSSLLIPLFIVFAASGLWWLNRLVPKMLTVLFVCMYIVFVARFFFMYFFSYPIIGTQGEYFSERLIASYIQRNPENQILVYASEPISMFESILVYTNAISKNSIDNVHAAYIGEDFSHNNFKVLNKCYEPSNDPNVISIVNQATQPCNNQQNEKSTTTTSIPSLIDSGALFTIHNDTLCSQYPLNTFSHVTKNLFNVESLTDQMYCSTFIIRN